MYPQMQLHWPHWPHLFVRQLLVSYFIFLRRFFRLLSTQQWHTRYISSTHILSAFSCRYFSSSSRPRKKSSFLLSFSPAGVHAVAVSFFLQANMHTLTHMDTNVSLIQHRSVNSPFTGVYFYSLSLCLLPVLSRSQFSALTSLRNPIHLEKQWQCVQVLIHRVNVKRERGMLRKIADATFIRWTHFTWSLFASVTCGRPIAPSTSAFHHQSSG